MLCGKICNNRTCINKHKGVSWKRDQFGSLPKVWLKMHKLCHNETKIYVPYKAIVWMPSMWNDLEHRWCCTESLQQRSQDDAFTIKGQLLPLEDGNLYRWVVKNIPEEGSGRWKDDTVCNQRLFIFQDQGNISKGRRRTQKLPRGPLCKYATYTAMLKELVVFARIKF